MYPIEEEKEDSRISAWMDVGGRLLRISSEPGFEDAYDDNMSGKESAMKVIDILLKSYDCAKILREDQLSALGLGDSDSTIISEEISRVRDEGRSHFHDLTKLQTELTKYNLRDFHRFNRS